MTTPQVHRLTPLEYQATIDKIRKLNDRAVKRGFTGLITVTGERKIVKDTGPVGLQRDIVVYDTTITGEPPKYDGWTFLAAIDLIDNGVVINTVPGVDEVINPDSIRPGHCDHCNTERRRKRIFLVDHDTGDRLQVGSTCVKDFLGWDKSPVFYSQSDLDNDLDSTSGGWADQYDVRSVLAHAWAATVVFGFVPTTAYTGVPTKYIMDDLLHGRTNSFTPEELDKVRSLVDTADTEVDAIIDFINSDEFSGSNYANNLKAIIGGDGVDPKHYGLIASAPNALTRHREHLAGIEARKVERDTYVDGFIGDPKDKVTVDVTIKAIRYIHGQYGTTTLYVMLTDTNHLVKWFSSNGTLGDDEGGTFRITGTVKGHDEYDGQKSTILTRCKIIEKVKV